jgi:hypothetical protein
MTKIEVSETLTETMLKTIGERIDHMVAQRSELPSTEWELVLNGAVNALDKALDNMLEAGLLLTSDYNDLDDAMDNLAELEY